ncbi:MAG: Crp/Fnr family transcriptional regulator [Ruminococcaceae bacterium]|nr:Crp/Fnr family transcriptional regulator [Oscillospiraceae bacterium]
MENCVFSSVYGEVFPFWECLSPEDRDVLCRSSFLLPFEKGTVIHDGSECTGVILVKSGCLRVCMLSEEGKEITLYRLYSGDICILSASCVLQNITFDVFVSAEEDSECCVIGGCAFAQLSERVPEVKIYALEATVSRFSDVMWVMQQILFMSIDKRLAIFLLDESSKTGSDTIKLTHEQIARYMGSAREVVTRMLRYFASEGIVEVTRKGVILLDKPRLRSLTR